LGDRKTKNEQKKLKVVLGGAVASGCPHFFVWPLSLEVITFSTTQYHAQDGVAGIGDRGPTFYLPRHHSPEYELTLRVDPSALIGVKLVNIAIEPSPHNPSPASLPNHQRKMFGSAMPRIWNSGLRSSSASAQSQDPTATSSAQQPHMPPPPSSSLSSLSSSSFTKQPQQRGNFKSALERISVPESLFRGIGVFRVNVKGKLEPATLALSNDKFVISVLPRTIPQTSRLTPTERGGGGGGGSVSGSISGSIPGGGGLKRPSILTRGRSGNTSQGSVGGGSIGTMGSMDGGDANFSFNPDTSVDIGSIDRIQSGQNTLLFEKAR
jgi:hypothetical protein